MLKTKKNYCANLQKNYHFSILGSNFLSIEDLHKYRVTDWLQNCHIFIFLLGSWIANVYGDYAKNNISFINDSACTQFFSKVAN